MALAAFPRFARDRRGVSAIEFAFIAPILVLFYFASVEISLMLQVDRKVTNTASAIGDLVAQTERVDANEIGDIFTAARAIMDPFGSGALQMQVVSVEMETDGDVIAQWSRRPGGVGDYACGDTVTVPAGILSPGQTVIMAEVTLNYTSPISQFLVDSYTLEDTFFLRPRRSTEVEFEPAPVC